jgi:hypothetical protein
MCTHPQHITTGQREWIVDGDAVNHEDATQFLDVTTTTQVVQAGLVALAKINKHTVMSLFVYLDPH